jgi:hypothetical protein
MHVTPRKRWMKEKNSKKLYPEDIENTKNNCSMNDSSRSNKLTNNMNIIYNIWTSNSEIYQALNNSMV